MAKLNKKTIDNVLNDFKNSLFISISLENNNVNHYDFFEFLKENEGYNKEYLKIESYNNQLLENKVAAQVYHGKGSTTILLEMIKANNKAKFSNNVVADVNINANLTDDDLDSKIAELKAKLNV